MGIIQRNKKTEKEKKVINEITNNERLNINLGFKLV